MSQFSPVAIVGQGCVLPGAHKSSDLWNIVSQSAVTMTPSPEDAWRISMDDALGNLGESQYIANKSRANCGGYIRGFNEEFIRPLLQLHESFTELDRGFKWALDAALQASQGVVRPKDAKKSTLIMGNLSYPTVGMSKYAEKQFFNGLGLEELWDCDSHPLNHMMSGGVANHLAQALNCGGRSFSLDAACASGLYAISQACEQLHQGEADLVLAGGLNAADPLFIHVGFSALNALSPSGQSRPFNQGADGLVPAEGAAFLALKRLDDAIRDGDEIQGLIRGCGLSNDGRRGGLLSPSSEGQIEALRNAYKLADLDPSSIGFVECHATGTARGDGTEIQSMREVFQQKLHLSSLKANIGHSITVSGIAGVMKVMEAIKHKTLPPTPNAYPLLPDLESSPYEVLEKSKNWESEGPRRAGVNSFGFGGNNAHVIVEEWQGQNFQAPVQKVAREEVCIIAYDAKTSNYTNLDHRKDILGGADSEVSSSSKIKIKDSGFPPKDLESAFGQQLLALELAQSIRLRVKTLDLDNTAILMGMGTDAEVCRFAFRARLESTLNGAGDSRVLDRVARKLESQDVLGTMPNIMANRVGSAWDARAASYTLSQEDGSGLLALEQACAAIEGGQYHTALVGAADICQSEVSEAALNELMGKKQVRSGGAVILLKSRSQAQKDGDQIIGVLTKAKSSCETVSRASDRTYHHNAEGLIQLAERLHERENHYHVDKGSLNPDLTSLKRNADLFTYCAYGNQTYGFQLSLQRKNEIEAPKKSWGVWSYAADNVPDLVAKLKDQKPGGDGESRLIIWGQGRDHGKLHQQALKLLTASSKKAISLKGICFMPKALKGKTAAMYPGAASAYPEMGKALLLEMPKILDAFENKIPDMAQGASWIYDGNELESKKAYNHLLGSSFLCQIHSILSQNFMGLSFDGIGGLSSGETNSLFAHGLWKNMEELLRHVSKSELYEKYMGGDFDAVREAWSLGADEEVPWVNYRILESLETVKDLIRGTERVYISIINNPKDLVLCGHRDEVLRVLDHLAPFKYQDLGHDLAVHCSILSSFKEKWAQIHTRTVFEVGDIDVYSNFHNRAYQPNTAAVSEALTGQAFETVDFPSTVRQMWADGYRIFIEHGPRQGLSQSIKEVLGEGDYLAIAYDAPHSSGYEGVLRVAANLWAAGVEIDWGTLAPDSSPSRDFAMDFPWQREPLSNLQGAISSPEAMNASAFAESKETSLKSKEKPVNKLPGPKLSREDLKIAAGGKISAVLGEEFKGQDHYSVQVRMPEPPLLLCDRVLGIDGKAKSMAKGTIWTETDVFHDSWYMVNGRMPAGIFIESGQADLLLISWLGIDFINQGKRAYRLLGCELCFHGPLPKAGDTLSYEIHVDGHAKHGDVRLFFFHYDCYIDGELRISVRSGQAGFFSKEELAASDGVLWTPEQGQFVESARLDYGAFASTEKKSLSKQDIQSLREGDLLACFGERFSMSASMSCPPKITDGPLQFIEEVQVLDFKGGPKGRGYLRAECELDSDHWYFDGHFKNDPCMPGTLMAEGCLEAMAVYMSALGMGLGKDAWRFEPIPQEKYLFKCRGQVTPESRKLHYEIFVDEVFLDGHIPTLFAHVLCSVDGHKAFLCERLGLRLVPDYPLERLPELLPDLTEDRRPIASVGDFKFDHHALLQSALGDPRQAFGPNYPSSSERRLPRLPGPPYHFMTRVLDVDGEYLSCSRGARVQSVYDFDGSEWYFENNQKMPLAVLMEVALQPCGWLASYSGLPGKQDIDLLFRNLDGEGTVYRDIVPEDRSVNCDVQLLSSSKMGSMIIVKFHIDCLIGEDLVFSADSSFGYFPEEAMRQQKGLPVQDYERRQKEVVQELKEETGQVLEMLPTGKLKMLDRIEFLDPQGGKEGVGYIRASKKISPSDWFFKAHFFQDPVQPGSLGVEAMVQLMKAFSLMTENIDDVSGFTVLAGGEQLEWHYRGQVTPDISEISFDFEASAIEREGGDFVLRGKARLWLGDCKIYEAPSLALSYSKPKN